MSPNALAFARLHRDWPTGPDRHECSYGDQRALCATPNTSNSSRTTEEQLSISLQKRAEESFNKTRQGSSYAPVMSAAPFAGSALITCTMSRKGVLGRQPY
jgi:hypothetical protein